MYNKIEILRDELNKLLDKNADFEKVYKISIKIDTLMTNLYRKTYFEKTKNVKNTA